MGFNQVSLTKLSYSLGTLSNCPSPRPSVGVDRNERNMTVHDVTNLQAAGFAAELVPFRTKGGTLRGDGAVRDGNTYIVLGRLEGEDLVAFFHSDPDFVVSSYQTPIAWHNGDGWHMPAAKYSRTTSCHQGIIGAAINTGVKS